MSEPGARLVSAGGVVVMLLIAWLFATDRRRVPWRVLAWGVGPQLALGVLLLRIGLGRQLFLGVKTVLNEFFAYQELGTLVAEGGLTRRSAVIASYALCGFANFGSLGILLGGLGGMAPRRRAELAQLGLRSILAGTLATLMTGCVAGLLL